MKLRLKKELPKKGIYILYILLIFVTLIPIMNDFLIRGHDIYFHLMRIEGLARGLKCGQFPVKIQPVWYGDFGYAVSAFYGDLFVYAAAGLRLLGFSLQNAYKGYLILCNIGTVLISGYCFTGIFKNKYIGLFGSSLYSLAVYRFVNLYTRGALGEYTGMMLLPLLMYACCLLLNRERNLAKLKKGAVLLGAGMAGILQCHMLTAEIACMMLALIMLLFIRRVFHKEVIIAGIKAVGIAVGLSAWFLVPFLDYMLNGKFNINTVDNSELMIQRQGVFLSQVFALFDNAIGQSLDLSSGTEGDFAQGAGLGLSAALLAFAVIFLYEIIKNRSEFKPEQWKMPLTAAFIGTVAIVMSTLYFPWDGICSLGSLFRYIVVKIQFPWRLTGIATLALSLLWCSVISYIYLKSEKSGRKTAAVISISVVAVMLLSAAHFMTDLFDRGERIEVRCAADMDSYVGSGEEYLPVGTVPEELKKENLNNGDGIDDGIINGIVISEYDKDGTNVALHCENSSDTDKVLEIPLLYYDGYKAIAADMQGDRHELNIYEGNNGVVSVVIPGHSAYNIQIGFYEKWYWRIAEIVSLITLIIIIVSAKRAIKLPNVI